MPRLLPAELAWYATGRFYRAEDGTLADCGYFLHLPFAGCPLFDGARSETTAHFTFAARPFTDRPLSNGSLSLSIDADGEFSLYLQRVPAGDFGRPASFAEGECIATFQRTSLVVDTALDAGSTPQWIANLFSARLVDSRPFEFAGRRHDLADWIGRGVTQSGIASTTPATPLPQGCRVALPFTGSALALG
ncbi:MAG: hypothetical protein KF800_09045 [Lysobacter sp.]|nr:hypothetical protein [Lysobacter sp.]